MNVVASRIGLPNDIADEVIFIRGGQGEPGCIDDFLFPVAELRTGVEIGVLIAPTVGRAVVGPDVSGHLTELVIFVIVNDRGDALLAPDSVDLGVEIVEGRVAATVHVLCEEVETAATVEVGAVGELLDDRRLVTWGGM